MENEKLTIEILNEVDVNEITPNLEYNFMIIGEQGKFGPIIIFHLNKFLE